MNIKVSAIALAAIMAASVASAATVTYESAEPTPKVRLVLDDGVNAGSVRFTLSSVSGFADYLGLGFDFTSTDLGQGDITRVSFTSTDSNPDTPALVLFGNGTRSQSTCGSPQCNFNGNGGSGDTVFDYTIRIGEQGGGKKNVSGVVFDVADVMLSDFSNFAVRAQETSNTSGSIKYGLVEVTPPPPAVPLPAAGFGLVTAIAAFGAMRRRKQAAA